MTLNEAMAAYGPEWLNIWLMILFAGAFVLPVTLLIWKPTRLAAILCVIAALTGSFATGMLYMKLGFVKLLGLPHIIVWTPLVVYLFLKIRSPEVGKVAKVIMCVISLVILISLMFDYFDVISYVLGDRKAAGQASL